MAAALTSLAVGTSVRKREVKAPLVRIRTVFTQGETPEQAEVELNLDPLEILKAAGVGILVGGVALAVGWILWDGLAAPTPVGPVQVFRGMKESPYWREQTATAKECGRLRSLIRQRRQIKKTAGCDESCQAQMDKEIATFEAEKAQLGCLR